MLFQDWRARIPLFTERRTAAERQTEQPDHRQSIAQWREAMASEWRASHSECGDLLGTHPPPRERQ